MHGFFRNWDHAFPPASTRTCEANDMHGFFRNWDHAFPPDDDYVDAHAGEHERGELKCKFCGSTDVYWVKRGENDFVLYDITSRRHRCKKTEEMSEKNVSAFDSLD